MRKKKQIVRRKKKLDTAAGTADYPADGYDLQVDLDPMNAIKGIKLMHMYE